VLRWCVYEAGKTHARASAPDHGYYAQVKERIDGKRAAISEARKIVRQAAHILNELGNVPRAVLGPAHALPAWPRPDA
jgi:transposase